MEDKIGQYWEWEEIRRHHLEMDREVEQIRPNHQDRQRHLVSHGDHEDHQDRDPQDRLEDQLEEARDHWQEQTSRKRKRYIVNEKRCPNWNCRSTHCLQRQPR
ncbi:MAG: hypothetical protein GY772_05615 [bacterium]|nr:hypothetical protein [bacterium]